MNSSTQIASKKLSGFRKMKRAYYYLFYKFYRFAEATPSWHTGDWKAGATLIVLEIWTCASLLNYYSIITGETIGELSIFSPVVFIPFVAILSVNYFAFLHNDNWKRYMKAFDRLPRKKNRVGSWIVFGGVLFVIANVIFSFYLLFQM